MQIDVKLAPIEELISELTERCRAADWRWSLSYESGDGTYEAKAETAFGELLNVDTLEPGLVTWLEARKAPSAQFALALLLSYMRESMLA